MILREFNRQFTLWGHTLRVEIFRALPTRPESQPNLSSVLVDFKSQPMTAPGLDAGYQPGEINDDQSAGYNWAHLTGGCDDDIPQ